MAKSFEPAGDNVLVKDDPRETVLEGIELPDNQKQQEMVFGVVLAVGHDVPIRAFVNGEAQPITKEGDHIAYGPYAGKNIIVGGIELRLLHQGQIEGYIRG